MALSHLFHLNRTPPQKNYEEGTRIDVNQSLFPILREMSLSFLSLKPGGFREPHWHPNAHELSYCVQGKGLMTIFSPNAGHDTFIIESGTLAFVPMGYLHHVQNIGNVPLKTLLCFSEEQAEEINLSSTLGVIAPAALGAIFNLKSSFFEGLSPNPMPLFIGKQSEEILEELAWQTNRFKVNLEAKEPQIKNAGGCVRINNLSLMPILEGLTMYSLRLEVSGIREPHWHPNAHELNYVTKGNVRITILSPNEEIETFEMQEGDISFLPRGYYHYIENIGNEPAHLAIFFNHSSPSDIGLSGCLGAYPNNLLASLFKVPTAYFNLLPKYQEDLFIVAGGG